MMRHVPSRSQLYGVDLPGTFGLNGHARSPTASANAGLNVATALRLGGRAELLLRRGSATSHSGDGAPPHYQVAAKSGGQFSMYGEPVAVNFFSLCSAMMPFILRAGVEQLNYEQDCEESWNLDRKSVV